ncbi:hypothetical protein [Paenibacillus sp. UMB4589-SE434]|uniref:hypothetical protein n=1 Tax=Paenibacillus sp. UMB4589-SE434 TaxID=3046314 RepID=UPI00254F952B|nr:hypothetical protein [Paenibacillus sp. UMB4589-SE434]MDK8181478.1 hypothetical protein [Paenibacillus sp. UMB4589-SE434]
MPNNAVFNTTSTQLYALLTNTYTNPAVEEDASAAAAAAGVSFRLPTGNVSVGGSQNLLLQISNPSGSGKSVYMNNISGGSSASASLILYSGGSIAGGTAPSTINSNLGNATTSIVTTKQLTGTLGGTPTTLYSTFVTAGIYTFTFGGSIVVPPNQVFTVSLGVGALTGSINLNWWEV